MANDKARDGNQEVDVQVMVAEIESLRAQIRNLEDKIRLETNPGIKIASKKLTKALIRRFYHRPIHSIKHNLRLPYRKAKIKYLGDPIVLYVFMFDDKSMNFGEELTQDIIERIFHRSVEVHRFIDTKVDMLGVGSVIHLFNEGIDYKTYVWGSGIIDDQIGAVSDNFIFTACRGKLTRNQLAKKYHNIPMGDPGLLSNLMYTNKIQKTDKIGVIAHFRDEQSYFLNDIIKKHPDIFKIISVSQPPEQVADQIKGCKLILSSSLHGLIVSDSFGVPNIHLVLSDNLPGPKCLRGGKYKFKDYYSGIDRKCKNFDPREKDLLKLSEYDKIIKQYKPIDNLDKIQENLIRVFPYR